MKPIDSRYPAKEKLKKQKDIEFLFQKGNRLTHYPFQMVFVEKEMEDSWIKFGVSARKKDFKKAVDRNLLKRRMRELYRLHKLELLEALVATQNLVMLVYVGKEIITFEEMKGRYLQLLTKLSSQKQSH